MLFPIYSYIYVTVVYSCFTDCLQFLNDFICVLQSFYSCLQCFTVVYSSFTVFLHFFTLFYSFLQCFNVCLRSFCVGLAGQF